MMKTKRFNWDCILMCVVGLLVASCAEDDGDEDTFVPLPPYSEPYPPAGYPYAGEFEGVWYSIGNDKEPIDTAYLTVKEFGSMSLSSIPCDSLISYFAESCLRKYTWEVPEWSDLDERFRRTATSTIETSNSFVMVYREESDKSFYFDLPDDTMTFPMRAEVLDHTLESLVIGLAPRKSVAVFDTTTNQWGVFLYYNKAILTGILEWRIDLGYKFITTKKIK
ncbi:MAG: hypothetical protein IKW98_10870 [Prevotella sp.]|nr:hypothetical protein [Prevotella sp.]